MGGVIDGASQMVTTQFEAGAAIDDSRKQYIREQQQANAAIQAAQEKGAYEQAKQRILNESVVRGQKVAFANSGVEADSGSAANTQANTAALGAFDTQQLAINAAQEVYGLKAAKAQSLDAYDARQSGIRRKATAGTLGGFSKFTTSALSFAAGGGGG